MSDIDDFVYTNDPDDPCSYCVQWVIPDEYENDWDDWDAMDHAIPMMPSGPVTRVFSGIHDRCEANMIAYQEDVEKRRAMEGDV